MLRPESRLEKGPPERPGRIPAEKPKSGPIVRRKRFDWRLGRHVWRLGEETVLVAILDVSPDGPAGGRFQDADRAFVRAMELADHGAGIIELSAAPLTAGRAYVSAGEELRRVVPVLKRLRGQLGLPIAVETIHAAVAEKAVEYGSEVLHDPSGLIVEPALARIAASGHLGLILSHMRGQPVAWPKINPMKDANRGVAAELTASAARAIHDGMERKSLLVDPGLGQGKRKEQDLQLLAYTGELGRLELPFGFSLSEHSSLAPGPEGLAAAVTAAILGGAHLIRSHDFERVQAAAQVADALLSA